MSKFSRPDRRRTRASLDPNTKSCFAEYPKFSREVEDVALINVMEERLANGTYHPDYGVEVKPVYKTPKENVTYAHISLTGERAKRQKEKIDNIVKTIFEHKWRNYTLRTFDLSDKDEAA